MEFIRNNDNTFTFKGENRELQLSANELSFIVNQFGKVNLREQIEYKANDMNGDTINLELYPYSYEEFIDEIFVDFEDEIDYGNSVSDDDIEEKILDLASFYEMEIN